ncbi:hypothetical protein HPMG_01518 [Helicobacter pullorum MIT 98-5489]|uniref:Uncharacterized protein n=1 Tax=Helicobacter pullorum MIT 98-5489 TaxID=537972 RepID=C5F1A6_9HELI|nr:hypothetical protein HPMG_01518 [Helicobacter pullorum MIT 98-5489]
MPLHFLHKRAFFKAFYYFFFGIFISVFLQTKQPTQTFCLNNIRYNCAIKIAKG